MLGTLLRNRKECLAYVSSPKRKAAWDLINDPARPPHLLVDQGTTTALEQEFLAEIINESESEPGPIIEIGTLFGFTTAEMALLKAPDRVLITVDCFAWNPWGLEGSEHQRLAERVLRIAIALLNVKLVIADKNAFYNSYTGTPPSMVFLDAIHSYEETKTDIEWARRAGCRFIAGHDYSSDFVGVKKAVEEVGTPEVRGTVWLIRL